MTDPARQAGLPDRRATAKRDLVRAHLLQFADGAEAGTAIVSERELAARLDVSRPTVRAAIEDLVAEGHLVRRPGRGTFTSPRKVTQQLSADASSPLGVPPAEGAWTSRVVALRTRQAGAVRAARFAVPSEDTILHVTRVRLVDAEPIAIERLELPQNLVPGLSMTDLESGNFYHLLRERYGVAVSDAIQTLEPAVANPHEAELLDIPVYFPLLRIERTTADVLGRTVEFTQSVYRSDRYRITSRLRFDQSSG
ncbi:GntR family transcriptional regulator [Catenulispora yoronensis]|uniref:GntR family transcriptional regulator n=1 Tax=Catenulispora yoronensis TaxID=450799 RepID=A0ABN2TPR9_9ACTN